jgi:hypothetical protein
LLAIIDASAASLLLRGAAAKRANPSRGGDAKPIDLLREVAGLPNRVKRE